MVSVSVIVPVYNTGKYLARCLDSILNQTLKELEIICVDDGSTDNSPDILRDYAEKDSRIHVIRKENGGLVSARKTGAQKASGAYIGYVDSDDWVESDMYECLYQYAVQNRAELVCSGYVMEGNYITVHYDNLPEGLYEGERIHFLRENAIFLLKEKDVGIRAPLCCKLFLAENLKKIQMGIPDAVSIAEDKTCLLSFLLDCDRVYVAKEAFYHYLIHPESMVHAPNFRYLAAVNEAYQYLIKLYAHPAFTKAMRKQTELFITELLYKGINSALGFENRNLFWVDPYWMDEIPQGSKVALYGAGDLGHVYRRQIRSRKEIHYVACVDFSWKNYENDALCVADPESLLDIEYDLVVITMKNRQKAKAVTQNLILAGIPEEKIRWFEQKEIFWKYAEANGWTD